MPSSSLFCMKLSKVQYLWVREIFFHPWFFKYNHGERIGNAKENYPSKKEKMENNIFNILWHKTYTAVQKKQGFPFP